MIVKRIQIFMVLVLTFTSIINLKAQDYSITPNDSIVGFVPFDELFHFIINLNNLTDKKISLSWKQLELEMPAGWYGYLCDNGNCYPDFPLNGTMDSVFTNEYGLISVAINPYKIMGTAKIRYSVWSDSNPGKIDTLTWIIDSKSTTSIREESEISLISIYPNPVFEDLTIENKTNNTYNYTIYNLEGKEIINGLLNTKSNSINLELFPKGIYNLLIKTPKNDFKTNKRFIKK